MLTHYCKLKYMVVVSLKEDHCGFNFNSGCLAKGKTQGTKMHIESVDLTHSIYLIIYHKYKAHFAKV